MLLILAARARKSIPPTLQTTRRSPAPPARSGNMSAFVTLPAAASTASLIRRRRRRHVCEKFGLAALLIAGFRDRIQDMLWGHARLPLRRHSIRVARVIAQLEALGSATPPR